MGQARRRRVVVVHNSDFDPEDPAQISRADVVSAARDVARALASAGHAASLLPVDPGEPAAAVARLVERLSAGRPDLVFNLCESLGGDPLAEPVLPGLLELAGLRYTGSGPHALALAVRKDLCKRLLQGLAVPTPEAEVVHPGQSARSVRLPFPLMVKPAREDASTGITRASVVRDRAQLEAQVAEVHASHRQPALVERFIDGREVYVSLIGNGATLTALPMHEIDFSSLPAGCPAIVTHAGKWDPRSDEFRGTQPVRAELDAPTRARCVEAARAAFMALELRDYARVDLRIDHGGTPYVIDVNPNCDLSDGAGVSRAAAFGGWSYQELIARVCDAALSRHTESETHVSRDSGSRKRPAADRSAAVAADRAAAAPRRPARARPAVVDGRAVHGGGSDGRARARRRRGR
jgi:D-alanine-D-alanine ligase